MQKGSDDEKKSNYGDMQDFTGKSKTFKVVC